MLLDRLHAGRLLGSAALAIVLATATAGCKTTRPLDANASIETGAAPTSESQWRHEAQVVGERYRAKPRDPALAIRYAQALRAIDQRAQAAAVLEQTSMHNPHNRALLGAYGRALADVGQFKQALDVLSRAHTPDQPDWRVLSVQGAVLDQMGRPTEAQRYYASALKIAPDEPSVLSNLGLSYALAKDLPRAEATLKRAAARSSADPRIRQNLALVVGLQGRFAEAETIARADLPPEEAAANVAYLRQMLAQKKDFRTLTRPGPAPAPRGRS
jgi:Flp pilus assembly protein TadD